VEALSKAGTQSGGGSFGTSEPTAFKIAVGNTGGLFELDTTQYTIQCIGLNNAGKYIFRVNNLKIKNSNTNPSGCVANSGTSTTSLTNYVISQAPSSYTISNILPATIPVINVGSPQSFSFDVESTSATPGSLLLKVLFHSSCTGSAGTDDVPVPISIKFDDLPSCSCTDCDKIKIDITSNPTPTQNGNNVKFTQAISTLALPANTPLKIKSISAEIIYVDIKKDEEQCYRCDKNSEHYGKFIASTLSATGFTQNSTLPSGEVVFTKTAAAALTNANLSFEIAAPDLNKCCKDTVTVCIKYTIVTEDCKSCSVTKCYALPRSN
jgi:hypothetical protein